MLKIERPPSTGNLTTCGVYCVVGSRPLSFKWRYCGHYIMLYNNSHPTGFQSRSSEKYARSAHIDCSKRLLVLFSCDRSLYFFHCICSTVETTSVMAGMCKIIMIILLKRTHNNCTRRHTVRRP